MCHLLLADVEPLRVEVRYPETTPVSPVRCALVSTTLIRGTAHTRVFPESPARTIMRLALSTCLYTIVAFILLRYGPGLIMNKLVMSYDLPRSKRSE